MFLSLSATPTAVVPAKAGTHYHRERFGEGWLG